MRTGNRHDPIPLVSPVTTRKANCRLCLQTATRVTNRNEIHKEAQNDFANALELFVPFCGPNELLAIQARQSQSRAATVFALPSPRKQLRATDVAGQSFACALHGLSCTTVCKS